MSVPYDETVMSANGSPPGADGLPPAAAGSAPARGVAARVAGRPVLTAALGAACISATAILVTLARTGPVTTTFYRCLLSLPALVPLAVLEQRRHGPRPVMTRLAAMVAGLFLALDLVLWNHAIADVGPGIATVLGNLQVLFVAAFAWLVLRERLGRRYLIALPVVLIGVVLVSGLLGAHAAGLDPMAGIGFGIANSAAYACFLMILRASSGQLPHVAGPLADATAGATVGAVLIGLMTGGLHLAIGWSSFGWLLTLALLSGTVGWLLITSSLPRLPASLSSLLLLLQPAAALVLADLVLGDRPTIVQVLGAVLVCLGVLAVSATRRSGPAEQVPDPADDSQAPAAEAQRAEVSALAKAGAVTANKT